MQPIKLLKTDHETGGMMRKRIGDDVPPEQTLSMTKRNGLVIEIEIVSVRENANAATEIGNGRKEGTAEIVPAMSDSETQEMNDPERSATSDLGSHAMNELGSLARNVLEMHAMSA